MVRVLLLGRNGQLGRALDRPSVIGGTGVALGRLDCDLTDPVALEEAVSHAAPAVIVNAAAYTAVDRAEDEPALAHAVNARAPEVLARLARSRDAVLIHYSTDYVFAGDAAGARVETDPTRPASVYGKTKLAGEQAIIASGCRHVIIRTSWVYGAEGANFPRTMLRLARERDALSVVDDQFGTPTPVTLLAGVTARFIDDQANRGTADARARGVFHCAAKGCTNWRDYAVYFLTCCREYGIDLRVDPDAIAGIASADYPTRAPRPKNSLLSSAKLEQTFGLPMPDWREGVRDLAQRLAQAR